MNRKYSVEQQQAAVALVVQRRLANPLDRTIFREVAEQTGVGEQSLRIWVRQADETSHTPSGLPDAALPAEVARHELEALRRKILRLQAENDVLKRAFVMLSTDWEK